MTVTMDSLDEKAATAFDGYLVRKDLVRKYSRQYPVPTYVVEFLLGDTARASMSKKSKKVLRSWKSSSVIVRCGQEKRNCLRRTRKNKDQ